MDIDKMLWDLTEGKRQKRREEKEAQERSKEESDYFDELRKKRKAGAEAIKKKYSTEE